MKNPFVKGAKLIHPPKKGVIVLDRIEPGVTPDYCTHGKATCVGCDEWCWLGDKSHDVVASGRAAPLCLNCAALHIPRYKRPVEHVEDHRRVDGAH